MMSIGSNTSMVSGLIQTYLTNTGSSSTDSTDASSSASNVDDTTNDPLLSDAASILGTSQSTLESDLNSGQSLSAISNSMGISTQDFLTQLVSMSNTPSTGSSPLSNSSSSDPTDSLSQELLDEFSQTGASSASSSNDLLSVLDPTDDPSTTSSDDSMTSLFEQLSTANDPIAEAANVLGVSESTLLTGLAQSQSSGTANSTLPSLTTTSGS